METTYSPSTDAVVSGSRQTERILLALTRQERSSFLPALEGSEFESSEVRWADDSELTPAIWETLLREVQPTILVTCWSTPPLPAGYIDDPSCPLKYVCHLGGSVRHIVPRRLIERGVAVTNWGGLVSTMVAEHALLLVLAMLRNLPRWSSHMKIADQGEAEACKPLLGTRALTRREIGIHGFGGIARELIRLLQPFAVRIRVFSEGVEPQWIRSVGAIPYPSIGELFDECGIIVECEALTERSRGMVTADLLRRLPPGAVFVNVGRGAVVDEAALAEVAHELGLRIASDVFQVEPVPQESAMWEIDGALFSPHVGGPTHDGFASCGNLALRNIHSYLEKTTLSARVDLPTYDRST